MPYHLIHYFLFMFYWTDLRSILNRLGEKMPHQQSDHHMQRLYTGNVDNILRNTLQAFRLQRFNPETRFLESSVWDSNKEENLAQLCRQKPCLYDVSSSCYLDRAKKDAEWKEITEE